MKNKILAAFMILAVALVVTSCTSSRKGSGCPVNVGSSNKPFRA
jgi:predicted small secreted protein